MKYLARLVEQTGLSVVGREPEDPAWWPRERLWPGQSLEEITIERPALPPVRPETPERQRHVPPPPVPVPTAERARVEPTTGRPEEFSEPRRIASPEVHSQEAAAAPRVAPQGPAALPDLPPRSEELSVHVTRNETLRRVVEWVSANDPKPSSPQSEPTEVIVTRAAPPPLPTTRTSSKPKAEMPASTPSRIRRDPEPGQRDVMAERIPIIEARNPELPTAEAPAESGEERVDISIGTINVTLEAPPRPREPATPPIPAPAAPPPPQPRQAPMHNASNRLRRRFIRV